MQDQDGTNESILRERGWVLNEQGWWMSPHFENGVKGRAYTLEDACARESLRYRKAPDMTAVEASKRQEAELQSWGLDPSGFPLPEGRVALLQPTATGPAAPKPTDLPRPPKPPPPPPRDEDLPVPDGQWLRQRYDRLNRARTVDADFLTEAFTASDIQEAGYREAVIPGVYAGGSLVTLGSKKNTTSTQVEELAVTFMTGSHHWGLPEFAYRGDLKRVLLIQEENEPAAVMQDFANIIRARGLPSAALDGLLDSGQLRILSRRRLNFMNDDHRALVAGMCEGVFGRQGYDVLILDRVDKMGMTDITNAAGELQAFLNWLTAVQSNLGTDTIFSWPRVSNAKAFTFDTCLGGETIPRWWQSGMLVQRRDPCRVDVKIDMLRHRLGEHRHFLNGVSPVGEVGEWELRSDSTGGGEKPKSDVSVKRGVQVEKFRALLAANPDITNVEAAKELGVVDKTITRYRKALAAEAATDDGA